METKIREYVETIQAFLEEDVECHFNWDLEKLDTGYFHVLERFEAKLRDKDLIVETPLMQKWTLKLSYGYEFFKVNEKSGVEIVEEAVDEMESTEDDLCVKYKTAFRHVACSLLAAMLFKINPNTDPARLNELILKVTKFENMSKSEKSGVLGLKANVLRWYGTDGTKAAIPIITEASCICPEEFEWKLSRVITLTRMRHFHRGQSISWADVAVPIEILEELIKSKDVIGDREVVCKYFLAVTHKDLILMQEGDPEQKEKSTAELNRLCKEIQRTETTSPQVVSFVAQQMARNGQTDLGIDMIKRALGNFPRHIGLNTTISNLYKTSRNVKMIAHHSKIAMEEGGYGASWIYFECAIKTRTRINFEDFFNTMLSQHHSSFKAQTHVQAALFYYFHRRDILRGSLHIKSALEADETYDGIRDFFCTGVKRRVNPLEIAYNQVHISMMRKRITYRDRSILREVQEKISSYADVTNFTTSMDLVSELLNEFHKGWHRKKSTFSAGDVVELSHNNSWRY